MTRCGTVLPEFAKPEQFCNNGGRDLSRDA
jgi:hypothetical protein